MRTINKTAVAKNDAGGNFITTSGIYPLHLKGVELAETTNGAVQANYFFDSVMSYGNLVIKKDGGDAFGFLTLDSLGIIEGVDAYASTPDELTELELKFKNSTKTVMVIPEFEDIDVVAHIQYAYGLYNDEVQERVSVKRFYRVSDFATSTEIVDDTTPGAKYATDMEKYASTVIYKDGLDAEKVAAWKEAQKSGNAATTPTNTAAKAGFGGGAAKKGFGRPATGQ